MKFSNMYLKETNFICQNLSHWQRIFHLVLLHIHHIIKKKLAVCQCSNKIKQCP